MSRFAFVLFALTVGVSAAEPPDFARVEEVFNKHCLDCHSATDPEKNLVLENHASLLKGGESGAVVLAGRSSESLLAKFLEGNAGKTGKNQFMPPGKRERLTPAEIALVKAWIDAGALPSRESAQPAVRVLKLPKIEPKVSPPRAIHALANSASAGLIAVARYGEVELFDARTRSLVRTLAGHRGHVNAVAFSSDGRLVAAAGEPGQFGEARLWNTTDGSLLRVFEGHKDALYSAALSPDGRVLATGSYDQKIKLWEVATGKELRTLAAHNGAIFGLAFRRDGKVLASASADRTIKLWDVATGRRLDTLSQPLKEQYTVAFSPDGTRLAAAGVDNRIRVWQISATALEGSNSLLESRFAHEGAIMKLAYSADGKTIVSTAEDRTVKLWDALKVTEKLLFEKQPDLAPALGFSGDDLVVVGRLDGTLEFYDATTGRPAKLAAKL